MKILVTGGAGFIGSHLVDAYLARGNEVVILDDLSTGKKTNIGPLPRKNLKLYETKLQSPEIRGILKNEKPDLVNHHAAQKSVRDSVSDPVKDADINLLGLVNLLEACRESGCRKVLYASSGGVAYGEQKYFPADEDHPKEPLSPYGVSKYASELYLNYYAKQFGFAATALRYANVYGPRQDPLGEAGVVAIFCQRMKAKQETLIYGSGKQTRDFVYVSDVVNANEAAEQTLSAGIFKAFNVGTGGETSVIALHAALSEILKYGQKPVLHPAQPGEQMRSVLSAGRLKAATGWAPKITLTEGLRCTAAAF